MGTSWGQIAKEEAEFVPGILDYTKCQSAAFTYSVIMLLASNLTTY